MTSATLYREGADLDELLADLDAQYPGRVRVVEISYPRSGGVGGFFAKQKVAVEYVLLDAGGPVSAPCAASASAPTRGAATARASRPRPRPRPSAVPASAGAGESVAVAQGEDVLGELIAAAEAGDDNDVHGPASACSEAMNAEFAQLLLEMAAQKSAARRANEDAGSDSTTTERGTEQRPGKPKPRPMPVPGLTVAKGALNPPAAKTVDPVPASMSDAPKPAALPVAAAPAFVPAVVPVQTSADVAATSTTPATATPLATAAPSSPHTDTQLALRRKLAEIGVPISWMPNSYEHPYAVVEQLVAKLPAVPPLSCRDFETVVVAGPSRELASSVEYLSKRMRLCDGNLWSNVPELGAALVDVWQAAEIAARIRLGGSDSGSALIAVATDDLHADARDDVTELIGALAPDALWTHVDASRKPADTRAELERIGEPTALIVTGGTATASPATVWDLAVPIALLDGQTATSSAWAVLLLNKLAELDI